MPKVSFEWQNKYIVLVLSSVDICAAQRKKSYLIVTGADLDLRLEQVLLGHSSVMSEIRIWAEEGNGDGRLV